MNQTPHAGRLGLQSVRSRWLLFWVTLYIVASAISISLAYAFRDVFVELPTVMSVGSVAFLLLVVVIQMSGARADGKATFDVLSFFVAILLLAGDFLVSGSVFFI